MNIIDFLLDNIFIVVIAAGFLMSLLGKSGGKKPQNRMPTFGGEQDPAQQRRQPQSNERPLTELQRLEQHRMEQQREEARRNELARLDRQQAEYEAQQRLQTEQRRAAAEARQQEKQKQAAIDVAVMQPVRSSAARRSTTKRLFAIGELSRDELRRAVVMAEVLGPPRARKPRN